MLMENFWKGVSQINTYTPMKNAACKCEQKSGGYPTTTTCIFQKNWPSPLKNNLKRENICKGFNFVTFIIFRIKMP